MRAKKINYLDFITTLLSGGVWGGAAWCVFLRQKKLIFTSSAQVVPVHSSSYLSPGALPVLPSPAEVRCGELFAWTCHSGGLQASLPKHLLPLVKSFGIFWKGNEPPLPRNQSEPLSRRKPRRALLNPVCLSQW